MKIQDKFKNDGIMGNGEVRKKIFHYSYNLRDKIGQGYSSTVYIGSNDHTKQKVAIKVIQLRFIRDDNMKKMIQNQLNCIRKIKHPHLLKFIDTYETNNNLYIITEFCDGGDLHQVLRNKGRLSQSLIIKIFGQFYSGYVSLLKAGYIHRDIKPANILIKSGKLRIADFGIVKSVRENPRENYNVGTVTYMAPQSITSNIYTQKSDVWSIGVMLYQLAHGRVPWRIISNQQVKNDVLSLLIPFDSNWLSLDCIKFISQCLDRNPHSRISINEMKNHPWIRNNMQIKQKEQQGRNNKYNPKQNKNNINYMNGERNIRVQTQTQMRKAQYRANYPSLSPTPNPVQTQNINKNLNVNSSSNNLLNNINMHNIRNPNNKTRQNSIKRMGSYYPNYNNNPRPTSQQKNQKYSFRMQQNIHMEQIQQNTKKEINPQQYVSANNIYQIYSLNSDKQTKQILNKLMLVVDYGYFIIKSIKNIQETKCNIIPENMKNVLIYMMMQEVLKMINSHEKIIQFRLNLHQFKNWEEFVHSQSWRNYVIYVQKNLFAYKDNYYNQVNKLRVQLNQFQQIIHSNDNLSVHIRKSLNILDAIIKERMFCFENSQTYENLQLFQVINITDTLVTLYTIQQIILTHGWKFFIEHVNIKQIIEEQISTTFENYQEIWQILNAKIYLIFQD